MARRNIEMKFVKPVDSKLIVRDEKTMTPLPADGTSVVWTTYWRRRLKDGSIILATAPTVEKKVINKKEDSK